MLKEVSLFLNLIKQRYQKPGLLERKRVMFGQNEIRGREGDGSQLQVREVFHTLQGEGPHTGLPAIFIRLTGCNLACVFCDTKWDDKVDKYQSTQSVSDLVWRLAHGGSRSFTRLVVLTGGEPLRQDISFLLHLLINFHGFVVQIETAGTLWQDCLSKYTRDQLQVVVSPKTPVINQRVRQRADAFKYVVSADTHFGNGGRPWASTQGTGPVRQLASPLPETPVYLSPCDEYDDAKNLANNKAVAMAAMKYGYRAGVQLHKLLGLD